MTSGSASRSGHLRSRVARWRRAWRRFVRVAPWLLAAVVLTLVLRQALTLDWQAAFTALYSLPWTVIAAAAAVAVAAHAAHASYDLVARRVVGHGASALRSVAIGAVSFALTLNFGALIGGVAVRLRLYRRAGVPLQQGAAVVVSGMVANWCGFAVLMAAALLCAETLPWPAHLEQPRGVWRYGAALLALVLPVLALLVCARRGGQPVPHWLRLRGLAGARHPMRYPTLPQATLWLALALASWSLAASVVWVLLQGAAPWWWVVSAMGLAAVAGVLAHVPGGLGVLEAVVLATLSPSVPPATVLAALLGYRMLYYGLPLLAAAVAYAVLERTGPSPPVGPPKPRRSGSEAVASPVSSPVATLRGMQGR